MENFVQGCFVPGAAADLSRNLALKTQIQRTEESATDGTLVASTRNAKPAVQRRDESSRCASPVRARYWIRLERMSHAFAARISNTPILSLATPAMSRVSGRQLIETTTIPKIPATEKSRMMRKKRAHAIRRQMPAMS